MIDTKRSLPHTIPAAMELGQLTEEEAYFILWFAGRMGYDRAIKRLQPPLRQLRRWFVWIGGWEQVDLLQWDQGLPAWEIFRRDFKGHWRMANPTPIAFFGHRAVCFGWGWQIRTRRGYLVFSRSGGGAKLYWSPDGTPHHAKTRIFWELVTESQR